MFYLNVSLDRVDLTNDSLSKAEEMGERYGNSDTMAGERILVDFSSPNTAKTMHPGHLRSTIIGQVVINLLKASGATTYGINHLGDWGTQFGQLVTGFKLWADDVSNEIDPNKDPTAYLAEIYKRIKSAMKNEPKDNTPLADDGRRNFAKLEAGDPETIELWNRFRDMSLIDFQRIYGRLGIEFDMILGESFFEDKMGEPVQDAINAGLTTVSDGALMVDLNSEHFDRFILRKSDG